MAFLDEAIRQAQAAVEHKFLFRKIGLPFDYASHPDDFPSKAFATAKEARANFPNPSGLGSGYHFSCRNHALLFDAYLLRVELGIEAPGDEAILDRLIGGLIRLDTVAPKSFLVGGLSPDGRGFYAQPQRENHAAWAFAVARGLATAAVAPESQEKFRSIAGKWMERIRREKFRLCGIDSKPFAGCDLSRPEPDAGPFLLAMLLAAARSSGDGKEYEAYAAAAEEESRARLASPPARPDVEDMQSLLWRQASLTLIAGFDTEPERVGLAKERLRENATTAARRIPSWREWDKSLLETDVDLEWRRCAKAPLDQSPFGFVPPPSWARLANEAVLEEALSAMYIVLLAGEADLAEPHVADMEECLAATPWQSVVTLNALAPAIGVHARGVEFGLWDKTLYDSRREPPASEISFAAKYLEPDYDTRYPDRAGHADAPPGKRKAEQGKGEGNAKKRRRRRRKA